MQADAFYERIVKTATQPPDERFGFLAELHTEVAIRYLNTIREMTAQQATRVGADGRTVGQVVGHIAGWERFTILAAAEVVAGVRWPRIMTLSGYPEPDGQLLDFASVDEFNAHLAAEHATCPWEHIQDQAIQMATALHALFTQPALLPPDTLERTRPHEWHLPNGLRLTIPVGWFLWMVSIEHEAVEHVADLG